MVQNDRCYRILNHQLLINFQFTFQFNQASVIENPRVLSLVGSIVFVNSIRIIHIFRENSLEYHQCSIVAIKMISKREFKRGKVGNVQCRQRNQNELNSQQCLMHLSYKIRTTNVYCICIRKLIFGWFCILASIPFHSLEFVRIVCKIFKIVGQYLCMNFVGKYSHLNVEITTHLQMKTLHFCILGFKFIEIYLPWNFINNLLKSRVRRACVCVAPFSVYIRIFHHHSRTYSPRIKSNCTNLWRNQGRNS